MLEECVDGQGDLGEIIMNNNNGTNLNNASNNVTSNEAEVFAILSGNTNNNDDL